MVAIGMQEGTTTEATTRVTVATPAARPRRYRAARDNLSARLLGVAVALAGLLDLASTVTPNLHDRTRMLHAGFAAFTPEVTHWAHGATALFGLALLVVGRGIAQRRRLAYWAALGLLGLSAVSHMVKGLDFEEATVTVAVAVLLIRHQRLFTERAHVERLRSLGFWIPALAAVTFAYGLAGLYLRPSDTTPDLTFPRALRFVAARLVGLSGPLHIEHGFGSWFPASLTVLGVFGIVTVAVVLLSPVAERTVDYVHNASRDRVRSLVDRGDGDTLDPFALRSDKAYVFSRDGRAAVAYRYVNGVGLASGDPVGDPGSFPDAVTRFLARCAEGGWRPAFMGVREDRLPMYDAVGLRSRYLGEEAVVDVASFTLDGRAMRPVRQAANRTRNHGITTEVHREGELDPTLRRALTGIADRQRGRAPERGFSMALDDLLSGRDADCVIVVARDPDGAPFAFQRYVPCRSGRGLSLDAMRRDPVGPNGVNERLIVDAIAWAGEHGVEEVSLNFAAFKGLVEEGGSRSLFERGEAWVVRRLNPYFQIESLYWFNAKFRPRWVRRHLVYRCPGDLAPVGVAALSAEAFLPFDRRRGGEEEPAPGDATLPAPAASR